MHCEVVGGTAWSLPDRLRRCRQRLQPLERVGVLPHEPDELQGSVLVLVEVAPDARGDGWSLDELHGYQSYAKCVVAASWETSARGEFTETHRKPECRLLDGGDPRLRSSPEGDHRGQRDTAAPVSTGLFNSTGQPEHTRG